MTIAEIERESGDDDDVNGFFFQFEHKRSDRRLRKGEEAGGPFISPRWMKRKENRELGTDRRGKRPKSQISGPPFLHGRRATHLKVIP